MSEPGNRSEKERKQSIEAIIEQFRPLFGNHDPRDLAQRMLEFVEKLYEYVQRFDQERTPPTRQEVDVLLRILPEPEPSDYIAISGEALFMDCPDERAIESRAEFLLEILESTAPPGDCGEPFSELEWQWNRIRAGDGVERFALRHPRHPIAKRFKSLAKLVRLPGRYDQREKDVRDGCYIYLMRMLEWFGLLVMNPDGKSGAGAMAMAGRFGLSAARFVDIWKKRPEREQRQPRCAGCGGPAGAGLVRDPEGDRLCRRCAIDRGLVPRN